MKEKEYMNLSDNRYFANKFSHIYVEREALNYPLTKEIINNFPNSNIIEIGHYKDIFNRSRQDFVLQKKAQSLILSVNHSELIYPGARFCQSFGHEHFYYTSNILNCIYDCEYCYLQGMYPSGHMVIFVNMEDYFTQISRMLESHPMYVCISYDTDLLAVEGFTHITQKWIDFAVSNPELTIEIRTKSAYDISKLNNCGLSNIIYAWTLSPDEITVYEHDTPGLDLRIASLKKAIQHNANVRLCFDPMIHIPDYQKIYANCYRKVFEAISPADILDVSIGVFRISSDYLKSMRKKRHCAITAYPYNNTNGICSYEQKKSDEMLDFARLELSKYVSPDIIYGI